MKNKIKDCKITKNMIVTFIVQKCFRKQKMRPKLFYETILRIFLFKNFSWTA